MFLRTEHHSCVTSVPEFGTPQLANRKQEEDFDFNLRKSSNPKLKPTSSREKNISSFIKDSQRN